MTDITISALIPVSDRAIGDSPIQTVSARDLHAFLGVGKDFSTWVKDQLGRARLIEGRDFLKLTEKGELSATGQTRTEYHLTIDAGKHIAMLSQTDKGFEVREYFIECERRALAAPAKALSPAEMLLAQCQMLVEQERRLAVVEAAQAESADRVKRIEAKQQAFEEGSNFFTVIGYVAWRGMPSIGITEAAALGRKATKLSKERGVLIDKVRDPRFGVVGAYHQDILEAVFAAAVDGM